MGAAMVERRYMAGASLLPDLCYSLCLLRSVSSIHSSS